MKIWGRGRGGDSKNIIGEFQGLSPKILELRGEDGEKIKYNLSSLVRTNRPLLNQLRNIIPDTVNGALLLHKVLANIKDTMG